MVFKFGRKLYFSAQYNTGLHIIILKIHSKPSPLRSISREFSYIGMKQNFELRKVVEQTFHRIGLRSAKRFRVFFFLNNPIYVIIINCQC